MKITNKHIIVVILLALSVGLAYDSLSNYINPYVSVTDVVTQASHYQGKSLQVMGKMSANSLQRGDDGSLSFDLTDGSSYILVKYNGLPPQNLDPENEIVVVGSVKDGGATLQASQIMVKCPSKYEGQDTGQVSHVFITGIVIALIGAGYLGYTMFWKKS
jgi:cytochrome c-type biogenesis protein CcmE